MSEEEKFKYLLILKTVFEKTGQEDCLELVKKDINKILKKARKK